MIALLYKDGDKRDPLNYRGITLLSVVGKAFAALINARLMVFCEKGGVLADEQAGFRRGRACIDQIFILKEVLNMRKGKKGKRTYTCFIDVKKAYDRVWRAGLWKTLWDKGVRGKMWRVIKSYYGRVESSVCVNGGQTDWFGIDVGVRQGCVLSPILFDVFVDGLARAVKATGLGVNVDGDEPLALLLYADDLVLIADSEKDLQKMLDEVHRHCKMWRVELNQKRTKVVVFGKRGVGGVSLRCGDMAIDEAAEYKYLGLIFEKRGWKKQREKMLRTARRAAAIAWDGGPGRRHDDEGQIQHLQCAGETAPRVWCRDPGHGARPRMGGGRGAAALGGEEDPWLWRAPCE